jgi:hypothetical protein
MMRELRDEDIVYHLDVLMATYIDRRASGDETRRVEHHSDLSGLLHRMMAVQGLVPERSPSVCPAPLAAAHRLPPVLALAGRSDLSIEPAVVTSQAPA